MIETHVTAKKCGVIPATRTTKVNCKIPAAFTVGYFIQHLGESEHGSMQLEYRKYGSVVG